ncbi:SDR family NAD(P)-dependent oxidoreductase [Streptomyces sp. NPDC054796]
MKTVVISGGTDGMGRALAHARLRRGDSVVIVGRDEGKGQAFLADAAAMGAGARAYFVAADLSLVAENRRVLAELAEGFPVVDALVLCARHFRSDRLETAEGLENTFALEYLSRFLLSHGLAGALARAAAPLVVNVSGPGIPVGRVRWEDPLFTRGYDGVAAQMQGGRANDLLGVAFAEGYGAHATAPDTGGARARYVLLDPGAVATSFSGRYDAATAAHVAELKRRGKPVEQGIVPIDALIDAPPAEPLSAFAETRRIGLEHPSFDKGDARRLHDLTLGLLARHAPERPGGGDCRRGECGAGKSVARDGGVR